MTLMTYALIGILLCVELSRAVQLEECIAINYDKELFKGMDIIHEYPHDKTSFTQGIKLHNGVLYESTGLYGRSTIRKVDMKTGKALKVARLPSSFFGEGISVVGNELFQLTWKNRTVRVYDARTLKYVRSYRLPSRIKEGWGMTRVNNTLVISDGTDMLHLVDPVSFVVRQSIHVTRGDRPLWKINELEYHDGLILANVWYEDVIVAIDLAQGRVVSEFWCNISRKPGEDVFNGIGYNPVTGTILLTGKLWDHSYEVVLVK